AARRILAAVLSAQAPARGSAFAGGTRRARYGIARAGCGTRRAGESKAAAFDRATVEDGRSETLAFLALREGHPRPDPHVLKARRNYRDEEDREQRRHPRSRVDPARGDGHDDEQYAKFEESVRFRKPCRLDVEMSAKDPVGEHAADDDDVARDDGRGEPDRE